MSDFEDYDADQEFDNFRSRRRRPIKRHHLLRFSTKRPPPRYRTIQRPTLIKRRPIRSVKTGRPRPIVPIKKRPLVIKPKQTKVVKKINKPLKKPIPKPIKQAIKDLKIAQSNPMTKPTTPKPKGYKGFKVLAIIAGVSITGFGIYKFIKHKQKTNGHTRKSK